MMRELTGELGIELIRPRAGITLAPTDSPLATAAGEQIIDLPPDSWNWLARSCNLREGELGAWDGQLMEREPLLAMASSARHIELGGRNEESLGLKAGVGSLLIACATSSAWQQLDSDGLPTIGQAGNAGCGGDAREAALQTWAEAIGQADPAATKHMGPSEMQQACNEIVRAWVLGNRMESACEALWWALSSDLMRNLGEEEEIGDRAHEVRAGARLAHEAKGARSAAKWITQELSEILSDQGDFVSDHPKVTKEAILAACDARLGAGKRKITIKAKEESIELTVLRGPWQPTGGTLILVESGQEAPYAWVGALLPPATS